MVRMLATLSAPTSGTATVCGHDVVREADAVRSAISMTGQFAALEDNLTARENLLLMARLRGYGKAAAVRQVDSLIDRFDIGEFRDKLVKAVSGGQRRRVDLAASLVVQPQLLVLDEPTTGLDPRSRQVVWSTIRDLVEQGVTLLLTTQYLEEADALADDIVLIDHGRAVAAGTPSELKARIGDQRVDVVAADSRAWTAWSPALAGRFELSVIRERRTVSIPAPDEIDDLASVAAAVRSSGIPIDEIALRRPTLDDAFLALTGQPPATGTPADDRPRGGSLMTTTTSIPHRRRPAPRRERCRRGPRRFVRYLRETGLLVGRGLRTIPRVPERLSDVTIQPIMFTLLFLYVFGSAIHIPGMLPGLPAARPARPEPGLRRHRRRRGHLDRLLQRGRRPVPVAAGDPDGGDLRPGDRPDHRADPGHGDRGRHRAGPGLAPASGRRPRSSSWSALMLLGLFAFTWFGVLAGMLIRSSDAMQGIGFAIMLPLSFLAGTFVPIAGMKLVPRAIAEWDPLSALVAAVRQVCQGTHSSGSLAARPPGPGDDRLVRADHRHLRAAGPAPLPDRERLNLGRQSGR